MTSWKLYSYAKCSTCKKAEKFLEKKGIEFSLIDIKDHPPTKNEIKKMLKILGERKKLFNTSGQLYRELKIKDKLGQMTDQDAINLLQANGMLIKRPFLIGSGNTATVGFKEDVWKAILSQ